MVDRYLRKKGMAGILALWARDIEPKARTEIARSDMLGRERRGLAASVTKRVRQGQVASTNYTEEAVISQGRVKLETLLPRNQVSAQGL
jgi:hypothetical protein